MHNLNLGAMMRPLSKAGVFRVPRYYCWGPRLWREADGSMAMLYSRWPQATGPGGWLTDSEIALARAPAPEGPYTHVQVLLRGRGPGYWDDLMAHNPELKVFDGRYYLYYISSRRGPTRGHIRDSQRIGVATAERLSGPYQRRDTALIEPEKPIFNVAVNPAITRMTDGRFLLVVKGDCAPKQPEEPFPRRLQAIGIADSPLGPFELQPRPAIADIDTEDASVWYDPQRRCYFAVFHAHSYIGLVVSEDGINWRRAYHHRVTGTSIRCDNGDSLQPQRLERPSVYLEDGQPRMLCLGAADGQDWRCLLVPLNPPAETL